jgi:hypothetical protein
MLMPASNPPYSRRRFEVPAADPATSFRNFNFENGARVPIITIRMPSISRSGLDLAIPRLAPLRARTRTKCCSLRSTLAWLQRACRDRAIGSLLLLALVLQAAVPPYARAESGTLERCLSIPDSGERLRCFDAIAKTEDKTQDKTQGRTPEANLPAPAPPSAPSGSWRQVRTPDPHGGAEAVSTMHTADLARSDLNLAGLMLRCRGQGFEVTIVLLTPFPPRARPKVKLTANGSTVEFAASVIPTGAAIALPSEATTLVYGPWQSATEVAVEVAEGDRLTRGVVLLAGLGPAVVQLLASCPRADVNK